MSYLIFEEVEEIGISARVELVNCDGANDFKLLLARIETETENGMRPIIYIEFHGDEVLGQRTVLQG